MVEITAVLPPAENFLMLAVQHAALRIDLVDRHQRHVFQRHLGNRHRPRQQMQDADLDGVGSLRGQAACQQGGASGDARGGMEESATVRHVGLAD
jgi:hypothetical protein